MLGSRLCRRFFSSFKPGDFCMLRHVKTNRRYLVGPLDETGHKNVKGGTIFHRQLLDQPVRSIVRTEQENTKYMAHFPSLEEYVLHAPRACTPIYPQDACAIIQMLDLAPGHRVLEAGTGNGSLTLHLARAVGPQGHIDTVDKLETHSRTAEKHLERFERGVYRPVVDLHLGSLSDVAASDLHTRESYDAVVLDMPDPVQALDAVLPLLRNDRFLVCYLPNMTQVLHLIQAIQDMPLVMEDTLETAWKHWEIRPTIIRFHQRHKHADTTENDPPTANAVDQPEIEQLPDDAPQNQVAAQQTWVCRPKNYDVHGHTAFLVKLRKCEPVKTIPSTQNL
ncbi:S-adenosyl-L-methionine-dependent methyltransferase [Gongronella butleri]|nr:S-adenosyl-L-methionine-dependent methyltransferase [Gongronella butleri]